MPGTKLKQRVGNTILQINNDILELLVEYEKVKQGKLLSERGEELKKTIKIKQEALEEVLTDLEKKKGDNTGNLDKTMKMLKDNIKTSKDVLNEGPDVKSVEESKIKEARTEAEKVIEDAAKEEKAEEEISTIVSKLEEVLDNEISGGKDVEEELARVGTYQAERVRKMTFHKTDLLKMGEEQKKFLDYQGLKEFRSEFEASHKYLRNKVNEWDRRRISDKLYDVLMDTIDSKFDDFMKEF